MKRLILMRHAKSDWSDPVATDHERSLNARGRQSADVMGDWMRSYDLRPDHVLCSDAARTRETLDRLRLGEVSTTFTRKLYLADPEVMLRHVHKQSGDCVMLVAHNPGCAEMAEMLATTAHEHPDFQRFPTGATAVLDFDIESWRDLSWGGGSVRCFKSPAH